MLGLQRGKVSLSIHNPEWISSAEKVIQKLWHLLGTYSVDIQHVGSTSIQYIHAKPIIDIAVAVNDFDNLDKIRVLLETNGISYICEDVSASIYSPVAMMKSEHIIFISCVQTAKHGIII